MANVTHNGAAAVAMAVLMSGFGAAQAAFEGRLSDFTPSSTCTATGPGKCTYFYDTTLDITILNNWNIGTGPWSPVAALGSAQALAASAGFAASGLTGWVLPSGDGFQLAGASNQYRSIWNAVGGTFAGLSSQFDGVLADFYWSGTEREPGIVAWLLLPLSAGSQTGGLQTLALHAVAVRPGDVAAAVPEPQTYVMLLLGLTTLVVMGKRRSRWGFGAQSASNPHRGFLN
jgi:hypothetical protein